MYEIPCFQMTYTTIRPCNENQLDALFILSLFRQSTSTCSGRICSSSSGGVLYIYKNWYVLCFLVECLLAGRPTDSQLRINSASSWFSLHGCVEMHGQQNIKFTRPSIRILSSFSSPHLSEGIVKEIEYGHLARTVNGECRLRFAAPVSETLKL